MGTTEDSTGATSTGAADSSSSSGVVDSTMGPGETSVGSTDSITPGDSTSSSSDTTASTSDSGETTTGGVELPDVPVLVLGHSQVKQFDFSWALASGAEYYQLLESATPGEPYVQVGADVVGGALSITQPLHFRLEASYVLRACNAVGCVDSATVDVVGTLAAAIGYFKASNTDPSDLFGTSLALSDDGSTLVVGATGESSNATGLDGVQANNAATNSGAAYVFVRDALDEWSLQTYVKASNTNANDAFGTSVALSADGNTLIVGAPYEASSATGIGGNQASNAAQASGAVYVFVRTGTDNWAQQAYIKASNTNFGDIFGYRVAVSDSGDTLAVAAYGESSNATGINGNQANNAAFGAGAVYVFERSPMNTWSQQVYLKASNTASGDGFGSSLALAGDGNTLAVGAFGEDSLATGVDGDQADNGATQAGAVYVFLRDAGNTWSQEAYVKASNSGAQDYFGWSVALSADGSTLFVGAYGEDGGTAGIDGDDTDDSAPDAGAVYVLMRDGTGVWAQQAYVKASNPNAQDFFGWSLATSGSGSVLAVTAYGEAGATFGLGGDETSNTATQAGSAYVLVRDAADQWSQHRYLKASNTAATDAFGWSAAASDDGNILAFGSQNEDSNAVGIGGNQGNNGAASSGAVYVY